MHLNGEVQRHAQYRGRFSFVRQAECAQKRSRGAVTWVRGPGFGSSFFYKTEKPFCVVELNGKIVETANTILMHLQSKF